MWGGSQAYGKRATHAASGLVYGKDVTLQTHGKNKYGRTLADVLLSDGTNVNHTLVKDGWWWYRKYARGDMELETEAREAKRGLWADPKPVPLWEWRKRKQLTVHTARLATCWLRNVLTVAL
jgi:micrococcal nuclease